MEQENIIIQKISDNLEIMVNNHSLMQKNISKIIIKLNKQEIEIAYLKSIAHKPRLLLLLIYGIIVYLTIIIITFIK